MEMPRPSHQAAALYWDLHPGTKSELQMDWWVFIFHCGTLGMNLHPATAGHLSEPSALSQKLNSDLAGLIHCVMLLVAPRF